MIFENLVNLTHLSVRPINGGEENFVLISIKNLHSNPTGGPGSLALRRGSRAPLAACAVQDSPLGWLLWFLKANQCQNKLT